MKTSSSPAVYGPAANVTASSDAGQSTPSQVRLYDVTLSYVCPFYVKLSQVRPYDVTPAQICVYSAV